MKLDRPSSQRLVVTHDDTGWTRFGLYGGIFFAVLALYAFVSKPRNDDRLYGSLGAAACCALMYFVFYEHSFFEVDRGARRITWRRRLSLGERSGSIDFGDIKAVVAQRALGDSGTPSRRVVFITTSGEVPVARAYKPDDGECDIVVSALREAIGLSEDDAVFEQARELARTGKMMEAIRLLCDERKLSLSDAHERVEAYRKAAAPK